LTADLLNKSILKEPFRFGYTAQQDWKHSFGGKCLSFGVILAASVYKEDLTQN